MKQENLTARSGIPSLQGGEDVNEDLMAELAEVDVRLTGKRAEIAGSPLGRYRDGRDAATADLSRERLAGMLKAVMDGDLDGAEDALAGMPVGLVERLGEAAGTLAGLARMTLAGSA